jgi:hypothetical protein
MGLIGTPPNILMNASTPFEAKTTFLYQCAMAVIVLVLQTSLIAIGQEGEAFVNLMVSPLDAGQLLRAKFAAAFIPVLPVFTLFAGLFSYFARADVMTVAVVFVVGLVMLMAVSSIQLAVGIKYATFNSSGRTRFVTQEGRLISFLICMASVGIIASPLALHYLWGYINLSLACILTLVLTLGLTGGGFKVAHGELEKLY